MAESITDDRTVKKYVARVITEVCSPAVVVVLLPLVVAWHATAHRIGASLVWGVIVALFSSVLPMAFIVRGARRGRWEGHHVRNRDGRMLPLSLCLASTAIGLAMLLLGHAPRDVVGLDVAMLVTLGACLAITTWWKISLHAAVTGGAVALLMVLYGPPLAILVFVLAAVCWSRVELTDHTVPQVIAGAVVGPVFGGAVFLLVR